LERILGLACREEREEEEEVGAMNSDDARKRHRIPAVPSSIDAFSSMAVLPSQLQQQAPSFLKTAVYLR
jgi:hypothetical protein